jgi:Protein of unknown function (DUF3710)
VLRRRRREGGDDELDQADEAQQSDQDVMTDIEPGAAGLAAGQRAAGERKAAGHAARGPWDFHEDYPQEEQIDCGSLLIPVRDGFDVQINVAEEQGAWVAVVHGESGMQLQAFAAPRSSGLWDDVRNEIAANIADSGGSCQEGDGPFGPELGAEVPAGEAGEPGELHPVRFLGVDGPRWFLRAVISGPAATDVGLRTPFDDVFSGVVVVRGDYPAPQRQQLEIRLPEEVAQALDEQLAQEENGWGLEDPFTRGPEITETR